MITNSARRDKTDTRDYILESLGSPAITNKEWEEGFDIEEITGFKIKPVKNQGRSYSCVGQATAYYLGVLNGIRNNRYREISAKSIYSLIAIGNNRGAYLRDGAKTSCEIGALWENLLKSFDQNGIPTEEHLTDKSWFNEDIKAIMKTLKGSDYYRATDFSIDGFAKAIRDGYGAIIGVRGNNNGTWLSKFPQPPTEDTNQNQIWGHALYACEFKIENGKKYIGVLNSWGEECGEDGWQWLGEEWFENNGKHIFNPWVILFNFNKKNMKEGAKILKDKNSSAVGVWFPAISEDVLKSYMLNVGKELPEKDGKIDWDEAIDGEFEFKYR